jgi:hypothetical protein
MHEMAINPWLGIAAAIPSVVTGIASAAANAAKTNTSAATPQYVSLGSQYSNSTDAALAKAYNDGGFQGVVNYGLSTGNTALADTARTAREQKLAAANAAGTPITWTDSGGKLQQAVSTTQSATGAIQSANANTQQIANAYSALPGTSYTPAQLAALFGGTPQQYLDAYNAGGYQGAINISNTGTYGGDPSTLAARNAALSELNAARNAKIGSSAPIVWTDSAGNTYQATQGGLTYVGGGLTPTGGNALINSLLNAGNPGIGAGAVSGAGSASNAGTVPANTIISAQDPSTATYTGMQGAGFSTTAPNFVQGAYTFPYQYDPNSSDPVGSSNALEQQTNDVVNFNDNALSQLYGSPEYQAAEKNNYLEALRLMNNIKGTQSGASGVASSGTSSAMSQGLNQLYGELYDTIPAIMQNLYGREVTGLDAIYQYENDAYAKGADQRDYDTSLYQWQYAQNKDNFLTDRNFQYLLNRDWIDDARYADETEWNRALAERQQSFTEWASTYRNADGTALSPAQYEQAQKAFENEIALADLARLQQLADAQAYNYYSDSSGSSKSSGSGSGSSAASTLTEPDTTVPPATPDASAKDTYDKVVDDLTAMLSTGNGSNFASLAVRVKAALSSGTITQRQYDELVDVFGLTNYV